MASQSGAYGSHIYMVARLRGLKVGKLITTGNEVDLDVAETIRLLVEDDSVHTIAAYLEGTKDGPARKELYCAAQQIMWDEGGSIIPLFTHWMDARSTNLGGHRAHPVGEGDNMHIHEWGYLMS